MDCYLQSRCIFSQQKLVLTALATFFRQSINSRTAMIELKKKLIILCLFVSSLASAMPSKIILFDRHSTLENWQQVGEGKFIIKHHLLQSVGGMGLLYYTRQTFGNVQIHVVYKVTYADTNSGIFVRIAHPPKDAWDAVHHGYEIQICDEGKDAFDKYHVTGAIYTFAKAEKFATKKPGEWNKLDIILKKNTITVLMNGTKVSEYTTGAPAPKRGRYSDPQRGARPMSGFIGIQNHDHDATKADSHVYFKEISVLPLVPSDGKEKINPGKAGDKVLNLSLDHQKI